MTNITRRDMLKTTGLVGLGLLIPGYIRGMKNTTDADLVLHNSVQECLNLGDNPPSRYLSKVKVHKDFKELMSLDQINGVPIEVTDIGPDGHGGKEYYSITCESIGSADLGASLSACGLFRTDLKEWVSRNARQET